MAFSRAAIPKSLQRDFSIPVLFSYALDWLLLIIFLIVGVVFNKITPNKRPFSLADPDISFPYTEHEACPSWLLLVLAFPVPVVFIALISILFTPGPTVPKNTPASMVWKRKFWEMHVGFLGLALSAISAFFFIQGMKNMFGKPRPDLLARCEPAYQQRALYRIGGFTNENPVAALYSADICQQADKHKLDDGFRSFPSGHSSTAAGALVYLSLFMASKFAVTIPFVGWKDMAESEAGLAAFPSRAGTNHHGKGLGTLVGGASSSLRRKAAAPPIYLLILVLIPLCGSIWIAASRWYDFRHHGFDILFGYLVGVITAIYSFRYYHMPMQQGAGWAWGPRSRDRAFWAGVGRLGFAGPRKDPVELADGRQEQENAEMQGVDDASGSSTNMVSSERRAFQQAI